MATLTIPVLGASVLLAALTTSAGSSIAAPSSTSINCTSSEEKVFSCDVGNKRLLLCANNAHEAIRYQFGKPGYTPELQVYSPLRGDSPAIHVESTTSFMQGAHITFYEISVRNGAARYSINIPEDFSHTNVDITVFTPGTRPTLMSCNSGSQQADLNTLEQIKRN